MVIKGTGQFGIRGVDHQFAFLDEPGGEDGINRGRGNKPRLHRITSGSILQDFSFHRNAFVRVDDALLGTVDGTLDPSERKDKDDGDGEGQKGSSLAAGDMPPGKTRQIGKIVVKFKNSW